MTPKVYDQDLSLKLRFKRVLFLLGYYSPLEVELSYYSEKETKKRTGLTDLDVLGLKYDPVLTPHRVVGDCKSGKVSDPNRLFWLRGVSDYFGAHVAYFLRPTIGNHARAIAPKLGLRVLDGRELSELEQNLNADNLVLPLTDPGFYRQYDELWGIDVEDGVKPSENDLRRKEVFQYLSYNYWYVEQHRNLFMLIDRFQGVAHLLSPDNPKDVMLSYAGLEKFAHCLLEIGGYIYSRGLSDVKTYSRVYLYGGPMALREREQLFVELQKLRLPGLDRELDPPYFMSILELINRIIHHPYSASKVLTYLEAIYGWCVLLNNRDLAPVFNGGVDTGTIVLARDMCITFQSATGLNENLYAALMAL